MRTKQEIDNSIDYLLSCTKNQITIDEMSDRLAFGALESIAKLKKQNTALWITLAVTLLIAITGVLT